MTRTLEKNLENLPKSQDKIFLGTPDQYSVFFKVPDLYASVHSSHIRGMTYLRYT